MRKIIIFLIVIINSLFISIASAENKLTGEQVNTAINELDRLTTLINKAEQGNMAAQYTLGKMYYFGLNVNRNVVESEKWYLLAAEQGHLDAQLHLANNYYYGRDYTRNDAEAFRLFQLAADQGSAEAQYYLGESYAKGNGIEENLAESIKWYKLAAAQNYSEAQYQLGNLTLNGNGIKQDYAEAVKLFKLAANSGNDDAQSELGYMYCSGNGVTQDLAEAEKWVSLPNKSKSFGAFRLGHIYFEGGLCGEKDYIRAAKMYEIAAKRDNLLAQHMLGYMYSEGLGVTQDSAKAAEWFKKACDNGFRSDCVVNK